MERRASPALFAAVLVSFLLPWFSISCQGQEMITATGTQILTGDYQSPMSESLESWQPEGTTGTAIPGADTQEQLGASLIWRIGAGIVLVSALLGLVMSLTRPIALSRWAMTLGGLQSAVLLVGLLYGPEWLRNTLQDNEPAAASSASTGEDAFAELGQMMGEMMLNSVKLNFGNGFYLALGASLALVGVGYFLRRPGLAAAPAASGVSGGYEPPYGTG